MDCARDCTHAARERPTSAPRMASHITSSMSSEPASRMYPVCGMPASSSGAPASLSMNARSNALLMRPARSPCSWCDMPPVPSTATFGSSGYDSTARRIAFPRLKQRLPVGERVLDDVHAQRDHPARPSVRPVGRVADLHDDGTLASSGLVGSWIMAGPLRFFNGDSTGYRTCRPPPPGRVADRLPDDGSTAEELPSCSTESTFS